MGRLVTVNDPTSAGAEAYRTLRSNIQFMSLDHPARSLLVTSAGADEGKSATLCNLAVVMAQAGSRIIVADGDLRRPAVHELFDLPNDKGLTTALLDEKGEDLPLQPTPVPGLRVLTAGPLPPNPADLLSSRRMRRVIDALVASADLVLFDAAPVTFVADAAVIASQIDAVILVVRAGKTRREMAARAKATLEKANARVLGVVVNNVPLNANLFRYHRKRGK